jgi:predicted RNA-binding protein YlqC (UPF0109 family)
MQERDVHELLLQVVRSLVDSPDEVELDSFSGEDGTIFRVEANPADVGRLIGKGGQTARALQSIANVNAGRSGPRYFIDIDRRAGA